MTTPREGTEPELICFATLVKLGLSPEADFTFQTAQFGGRLDKGGLVVDFLFTNPPGLAIGVQGEYFHYRLRGGTRLGDLAARHELALYGITLIFVDEEDLLTRPDFIVREALNFQDHSKLDRGR